jgi:hypothetical protein
MTGSEMSQKRKKHKKSRVFVPEDTGIEFAVSQPQLNVNATGDEKCDARRALMLGHIVLSITSIQEPPMLV